MSEARRQTRFVYDGFIELANGRGGVVEVGDIAAYMRERNHPMDAWQIRGELSTLEAMGLVEIDKETAGWRPVSGQDFESVQAAG